MFLESSYQWKKEKEFIIICITPAPSKKALRSLKSILISSSFCADKGDDIWEMQRGEAAEPSGNGNFWMKLLPQVI